MGLGWGHAGVQKRVVEEEPFRRGHFVPEKESSHPAAQVTSSRLACHVDVFGSNVEVAVDVAGDKIVCVVAVVDGLRKEMLGRSAIVDA